CRGWWRKLSGPGEAGPRGVLASPIILITLRNAQVRRISWVRGVRPVRGRYEWPPHDTAPDRPPSIPPPPAGHQSDVGKMKRRPQRAPFALRRARRHLILDSRNSTCFFATGSYFFFTSLSVMVREFFRVT